MCEGHFDGFSFGFAHPSIWRYMDFDTSVSQRRHPAGSLYEFYVNSPLPLQAAKISRSTIKLNPELTGFVSETYLYFDLDGDDVPDLAVWEGTGKGPGHLAGPTKTDDPWYRLVLVNIAGRCKILGSDSFSYGCGC